MLNVKLVPPDTILENVFVVLSPVTSVSLVKVRLLFVKAVLKVPSGIALVDVQRNVLMEHLRIRRITHVLNVLKVIRNVPRLPLVPNVPRVTPNPRKVVLNALEDVLPVAERLVINVKVHSSLRTPNVPRPAVLVTILITNPSVTSAQRDVINVHTERNVPLAVIDS